MSGAPSQAHPCLLALRSLPCIRSGTVFAELSCRLAALPCPQHASSHIFTNAYTLCTLRSLPPAVSPGTPALWIKSSLRPPWLQSMAAPSHGGAEPDSRSLQVCYMRASDALQELYANLREDQLMLLQVATAIWRKVRAHLCRSQGQTAALLAGSLHCSCSCMHTVVQTGAGQGVPIWLGSTWTLLPCSSAGRSSSP